MKKIVLFVCLIIGDSIAVAQSPYFRQVVVNRENVALGFNSVTIDTNRVLWLASVEGLMSYNGNEYTVFNDRKEGSVAEVTAVYTDHRIHCF
jgi:hypothetical protein